MLRTGVDLELAQLLSGETVAREHALDREPDDLLGPALEHLLQCALAETPRVARVAVVLLVLALVAGDRNALRVHHDHEVADIAVRRVFGLPFPTQRVRDLGCEPSERLTGGVDDDPVALAVRWCGDKSLHLPTGEGSGQVPTGPCLSSSPLCSSCRIPAGLRTGTGDPIGGALPGRPRGRIDRSSGT